MALEPGHLQLLEFNKEVIPEINWMLDDLFCRYGVNIPYFILDFGFDDAPFGLEWGRWEDYTFQFNELMGLLFEQANLPGWEFPDWSMYSFMFWRDMMNVLYDESARSVSLDVWTSDYGVSKISCTRNCSVVKNWSGTAAGGGTPGNITTLDSTHNIIQLGSDFQTLMKYDSEGNELLSVATDWTSAIAIGPDGYIYGYENTSGGNWGIIKRDPDDFSVISEFELPNHGFNWYSITVDSDGYVYILNNYGGNKTIEKWDYDAQNLEASHAFTVGSNWVTIAAAGELIGCSDQCADRSKTFWTMPTGLDEDQTYWTLTGDVEALGVSALENNYFVMAVYDYDDKYFKLQKYDINQLLIQNQSVGYTDTTTLYSLGSYPF